MKHVMLVSKESMPAPAIFVVEVTTKEGCKDIVPSNLLDQCKVTVKAGNIYSHVIL